MNIDSETILRVRASLPADIEGLEISMCCDIAQRNDSSDRRLGYAVAMLQDWMSRKNIR